MHGSSLPSNGDRVGPASTGTSRSLIERVRADESSAWERLVGLYAPLVLHWCRRYGLQDPDAADVFQEVFQAVAKHIRTFRKDQQADTFRGWLRTITLSKVRDHFRRIGREPGGVGGTEANKRLQDLPSPTHVEEEEAVIEERAERQLFHRGLELVRAEFEERTWQAFWRTAVDGLRATEVADELGMTSGSVRVAKCRVLQRLREELGDVS